MKLSRRDVLWHCIGRQLVPNVNLIAGNVRRTDSTRTIITRAVDSGLATRTGVETRHFFLASDDSALVTRQQP